MSELKNVVVDAISFVKKGANGEPIQIYKSADPNEHPAETQVEKADSTATAEPEVEKTGEVEGTEPTAEVAMDAAIQKSTRNALKDLFAPIIKAFAPETVEKAADIDDTVYYSSFLSRMTNPSARLDQALDQLTYAIWEIFWDDRITNGKELILQNIDDFKAYVEKVLGGDRSIQNLFFEKGDIEDMKKEDVVAAVTEAVAPLAKSLEGLSAKVTTMEKSAAEEAAPADATETTPVEKSAEESATPVAKVAETPAEPDVTAIIKEAISDSLDPISKSVEGLSDRMTTLENLRGVSKAAQVTEVTKTDKTVDEWPELNLGF